MKAKLTEGPVLKTLFQLTWPLMIGIFAVLGFYLADTYFIGQLGGKELAAISFTFPVVTVLGSLALGLGIGTSSLISRFIGQGFSQRVREVATDSLSLSLLIVTVLSILGFFTIDPLFKAMGADPELLPLIRDYMEIWYFNLIFVVIPMVGNGILRATGDTKFPAFVMIVAGGVNLILDPIFIFGFFGFPRLELKGAALATVLARMLTLGASIWALHFREGLLCNPFREFSKVLQNWKEILSYGLPAALNNAIVPLSIGVITWILSNYGHEAVAGFGVGTRLESIIMIFLMAISASLVPFIGQNSGAQKIERVQQALRYSAQVAFLWIGLCFTLIWFFGGSLVSVFSDVAEIRKISYGYLIWVSASFSFEGILLFSNSAFTALGVPRYSIYFTLFRMIGIYVPLAFISQHTVGYIGVFWAAALSNLISGVCAWVSLKKHLIRVNGQK